MVKYKWIDPNFKTEKSSTGIYQEIGEPFIIYINYGKNINTTTTSTRHSDDPRFSNILNLFLYTSNLNVLL